MGDLIKFPLGEPEPEQPQIGYCGNCGVQMLWSNEAAWPEQCPRGCSPVIILSWNPRTVGYQGFTWT